jgi:hypothetical protein
MDNAAAKWMLEEIDTRVARRRRPVPDGTLIRLRVVRFKIDNGSRLDQYDAQFLTQLYERMTEPARIKWI